MDRHARRLTPTMRGLRGRRRHGGAAGVLTMLAVLVGCGDRPEAGSSAIPSATTPGTSADAATTDSPESIAARIGMPVASLRRALRASPLPPPTPDPTNLVADDPGAVAFGRRLFFDPALSGTGDISCATCHQPARRFTDGLPLSRGVGTARRHAPTLVDAAHHRWFNWDGRSDSMWGHAIRPIEHPAEMAGDRTAVARVLMGDPSLRSAYESVFGASDLDADALPPVARPSGTAEAESAWATMPEATRGQVERIAADVGKALAAYQRTLAGGPTRFDDWVEAVRSGEDGTDRLSAPERRGLELFFGRAECWECHAGPLFSDGEFHNIGIPAPDGLPRDEGRYIGAGLVRGDRFNAAGPYSDDRDGPRAVVSRGVKQDPGQWGAFRTPMLRGVGRTAPYMHDGSMPDLRSVVRFYSTLEGAVQLDHHQESVLTPLDLSESEVDDLVAFLRTLDGGLPGLADGRSEDDR